jgi:hypothetical protein
MNRWFLTSDEEKRIAYNNISKDTGLPAYAVEKDWWVVQTLAILFEMEVGEHLVFKGGTSLSKSWDLIERFSEDIDLAINRSFFGFEGELIKKQRTKLRKASKEYISNDLYNNLQKTFESKGLSGLRFAKQESEESDLDPVCLYVYYPEVIESPGYIEPRVKIEIGSRSLREPYADCQIISILDKSYPDATFAQKSIDIPSVLPERTYLEKIFLLHEMFQRPADKRKVERYSRHLYDIYQISKTAYSDNALNDQDLYQIIVNHRYKFTKVGNVDYSLHQPQTISFIPPKEELSDWKKDYKTMQEQMIYGDSPDFADLIESLQALQEKINATKWEINIDL